MTAALFFITHEGIASNLINIAETIIQQKDNNLSFFEIPMDANINLMRAGIEDKLIPLDSSKGLLIITDIYGATPSNIAQQVANKHHADLISGLNLPMILRLLNYRDEPMVSLIHKVLDGAKQGIQHKPYSNE